jgi:hypothetical protein
MPNPPLIQQHNYAHAHKKSKHAKNPADISLEKHIFHGKNIKFCRQILNLGIVTYNGYLFMLPLTVTNWSI